MSSFAKLLPNSLPIFSIDSKVDDDKFTLEVYEPLWKTKTVKVRIFIVDYLRMLDYNR